MSYFDIMCETTGYVGKTTFWDDFTIADKFGVSAIKDTYNRAFKEWKSDVEYVTELTLVLNWKIWYYYERGNEEFAKVYDKLWRECNAWCYKNLKGNDLDYFFRTTD